MAFRNLGHKRAIRTLTEWATQGDTVALTLNFGNFRTTFVGELRELSNKLGWFLHSTPEKVSNWITPHLFKQCRWEDEEEFQTLTLLGSSLPQRGPVPWSQGLQIMRRSKKKKAILIEELSPWIH